MNPSGPNALYRQLADELRRQIRSGELAPSTKLPSEPELATIHNVARTTVRGALDRLRNEGLITTERGRGSFVAAEPEKAPVTVDASAIHARSRRIDPTKDAFRTDLELQGIRTGRLDITVERLVAPEHIASRLGLDEDAEVIVRRRVQTVGEQPIGLSDSWFPAELVEGTEIAEPTDVARGSNRVMADLGLEAVRRTDEVDARMPTASEAELLQVEPDAIVLVVTATERDAGDRPVEVHIHTVPTSRQRLVYEIDLDV